MQIVFLLYDDDMFSGHFESYDAIIFDVNTDDDSMAITGPPMAFLENSVIENVRRLLKPSGKCNE